VRVFPDTNVLASAFGTRGLCADVLRLILAEHELLTAEVVVGELRDVLARKFGVPSATIREIEAFLGGYHVEPSPRDALNLKLRDRNDVLVVTSAVNANSEILITGDRELLQLRPKPATLQIVDPRAFWNLAAAKRKPET